MYLCAGDGGCFGRNRDEPLHIGTGDGTAGNADGFTGGGRKHHIGSGFDLWIWYGGKGCGGSYCDRAVLYAVLCPFSDMRKERSSSCQNRRLPVGCHEADLIHRKHVVPYYAAG